MMNKKKQRQKDKNKQEYKKTEKPAAKVTEIHRIAWSQNSCVEAGCYEYRWKWRWS